MEDENQNLDIEANSDKTEELKKIEELSFDPDKFEDLEREIKSFLDEIVGIPNLKKFHSEYEKLYAALKKSFDHERRMVDKAKTQITQIYENANQVKTVIRQSAAELEKIQMYKTRVDEENDKVKNRKEDKIKKEEQIKVLLEDIKEIERLAMEDQELPETVELKAIQKVFDELCKQQEEQQEKLESKRHFNRELEEEKAAYEAKFKQVNE